MRYLRRLKKAAGCFHGCSNFASFHAFKHQQLLGPDTAGLKPCFLPSTSSTWLRNLAVGGTRHLATSPREVSNNDLETAFIYQQRINILDEKKQCCYLTKSILKNELPQVYQKPLDLGDEELGNIMRKFEQNIIDTRYPSYLSRCLNYKQHFNAAFTRLEKYNVQVTGKPEKSFLIMSKKTLDQFAPDEEIVQSGQQEICWDEVFKPIFHMQELKTSFKSEGPFLSDAPFPNPHTLFIVADKRMEMKHLIGQGLLYSFANAYTHALAQPENSLGMDRIKPVSVQCIINNGRHLTFLCYQLNTLDFTTDNGVKNLAWIEENVPMFEDAHLKIPGNKRYKGVKETSICVDGLNKEAFEKFLKFVVNE
eukprot:gene14212-15695_t